MSGLGLGLNLSLGNRGGATEEPYITPIIPQSGDIVRAWSNRRLIPSYLNGLELSTIKAIG